MYKSLARLLAHFLEFSSSTRLRFGRIGFLIGTKVDGLDQNEKGTRNFFSSSTSLSP